MEDLAFVWQRHELFHDAGGRLARTLGVPLVLFAAAAQVWEARKWGVRRPGWSRVAERFGEAPALSRADVVVCASTEVAGQMERLGARRTLVVPAGVDTDLFKPLDGTRVRERFGLVGKTVVGWAGSFRPFHGLDIAIEAIARLKSARPDLALLLVGDGAERRRIEQQAADAGLTDLVITGTVPYEQMPEHLAAMDIALVLHATDHSFHYAPIKLAEYLAAGKAVVAPRAGDLPALFPDDTQLRLVGPGPDALGAAVQELASDDSARDRLAAAGRARAVNELSWVSALDRVMRALGRDG
jgi:glycosyltransferase involved in cell wall biosynthesis